MSAIPPMRPVDDGSEPERDKMSIPFYLGGSLLGLALFITVFWWSKVGVIPTVAAIVVVGGVAGVSSLAKRSRH
ncbi:hypothetical protein R3Q06_02490 [Rhodococcus erythropolis]|uniref:hypothetical protein n=1 Tax=Rhodococcus erythropolis TaxID=1833 RepID=UPI0029496BC4|nr:hypothetical protein [Rhodococcus erythropolis]MDV6272359.1 hypothetical protein [Rhodococcus erythropolis]